MRTRKAGAIVFTVALAVITQCATSRTCAQSSRATSTKTPTRAGDVVRDAMVEMTGHKTDLEAHAKSLLKACEGAECGDAVLCVRAFVAWSDLLKATSRRIHTPGARPSPEEVQEIVEHYNERVEIAEKLAASIQLRFPEFDIPLAEYYGDLYLQAPTAEARATIMYYTAIIAGHASDHVVGNMAMCLARMSRQAGSSEKLGVNDINNVFLLPVGQEAVTDREVRAWKAAEGVLKKEGAAGLFGSRDEDVLYVLDVLATQVIAQGRARLVQRMEDERRERMVREASELELKKHAVRMKEYKEAIAALKSFEAAPNDLAEIEEVLAKVRQAMVSFEEKHGKGLPNAENIRKAFPGMDEGQLIELYYRLALGQAADRVLQDAKQLKASKDDTRWMFLVAMCHLQLRQADEAREMVKAILAKDPRHRQARRLRGAD